MEPNQQQINTESLEVSDRFWPGMAFPERFVTLSADRVRGYVAAVGRSHPAYLPARAGERSLAPAALLALEPFRFEGYYDIPGESRAVNARADWRFRGPLQQGDTLRLSAQVTSRLVNRNREQLSLRAEAYELQGRVAAKADVTISWPLDDALPEDAVPKHDERREWAPSADAVAFKPFVQAITLPMMKAMYLPGEENFHTSVELAAERGFPAPVVGGPHLLCITSEWLTHEWGENWLATGEVDFRFIRPVYVDDAITFSPYLLKTQDSSDPGMRMQMCCTNREGLIVALADVRLNCGIG